MKKILVDIDKWENLVRLAKAVGRWYNTPGQTASTDLETEYEKFCEWRHEEPYKSGFCNCHCHHGEPCKINTIHCEHCMGVI